MRLEDERTASLEQTQQNVMIQEMESGHDGSKNLSSVEKYNLDTKTWLDVPSMNEKRFGGSACVVDGFIWVFGGKDAKTVEFYDPATNKWQVSTNMGRQRQYLCVLSI
ncbi:unnamed protein product [Clavelina lepadiformis]|uniref:Uncharacterized protein n=1 Tax=Clavelina lepadiformis TaxID=159417 RepID=A0ABP0H0V5_CLALP